MFQANNLANYLTNFEIIGIDFMQTWITYFNPYPKDNEI